jgi:outer membrane biosynthesis protein TonB
MTGAPADTNSSPDRPAIVAPTLAVPAAPVAMTGVVQSVQGDTIVVNGVNVVVGPTARVTGDLKVGASVRVVASTRNDASLQAQVVSVFDDSAEATPQATATNMPLFYPTREVETSPTRGITPEPTERPTPRATVVPTAEPTERPEATPNSRPTPQPTEKPEVKPTESSSPQPTESPEARPTGSPPSPEPTDRPETPRP